MPGLTRRGLLAVLAGLPFARHLLPKEKPAPADALLVNDAHAEDPFGLVITMRLMDLGTHEISTCSAPANLSIWVPANPALLDVAVDEPRTYVFVSTTPVPYL